MSRTGVTMAAQCEDLHLAGKNVSLNGVTIMENGVALFDYSNCNCLCIHIGWHVANVTPCRGATLLCRNKSGHFFWSCWCSKKKKWMDTSAIIDATMLDYGSACCMQAKLRTKVWSVQERRKRSKTRSDSRTAGDTQLSTA